ncbi:MAG: AAA family ATPase, partial [Chromatiaceae bacterium]
MKLDPHTYKALKRLLLGLSAWSDEEKRKVFVEDALYGEAVLNHITWKQDADTAASSLIKTCADFELLTHDGKTPLCALLAEIRDRKWGPMETVGRLEQDLDCAGRKPAWAKDPYPGLMAFGRTDAPIFFGRRAETRDLLRKLTTEQGRRFLLVTGASGSGKSSLVRAGVWARLEEGGVPDLPGSRDWLITAMFPSAQGGDPFLALTNSLAGDRRFDRLDPASRAADLRVSPSAFAKLVEQVLGALPRGAEWLLILDQMEELFTPAAEALREPYVDTMLNAAERPGFR